MQRANRNARTPDGEQQFLFIFADVRQIFDPRVDVACREQTLQCRGDLIGGITRGRRRAVEEGNVLANRGQKFVISKPDEVLENYRQGYGRVYKVEHKAGSVSVRARAIAEPPEQSRLHHLVRSGIEHRSIYRLSEL